MVSFVNSVGTAGDTQSNYALKIYVHEKEMSKLKTRIQRRIEHQNTMQRKNNRAFSNKVPFNTKGLKYFILI